MIATRYNRGYMANRNSTALQSITIIGSGRLGTSLGLALHERGFEITSFIAAHRPTAARAVRLIKRHSTQSKQAQLPQAFIAAELHLIPPSRIYLFATPDDELSKASCALACAIQEGRCKPQKGAIALHTSGALSSDELATLREPGFAVGSLHPLVAVTSDALEGARNLQGVYCCIEGDTRAVRAARAIVRALDGRSFTVDSKKKALYHAAAVMTSGHTVALYDIASEILTRCGLDEREARRMLLPLLASTISNLQSHAPAQALTGTFARADFATLRLHLAALHGEQLPLAVETYRLLGLRAVELAKANGADRAAVRRIEEMLH